MNAAAGEALFATWQPRYAALGLPTFPVKDKRPLVRGYLKLGLRGSAQLVHKFPGAAAIGLALGRRTKITVLDVDAPDEQLLRALLARHGDTPFVVRTGRGHFQAWYRHNSEKRLIRPFPGMPVDILGGGIVVAPPSVAATGPYTILRGSLEDLRRLPVMKHSVPEIVASNSRTRSLIPGTSTADRRLDAFRAERCRSEIMDRCIRAGTATGGMGAWSQC
jgi:hypothetical protein